MTLLITSTYPEYTARQLVPHTMKQSKTRLFLCAQLFACFSVFLISLDLLLPLIHLIEQRRTYSDVLPKDSDLARQFTDLQVKMNSMCN